MCQLCVKDRMVGAEIFRVFFLCVYETRTNFQYDE